MRKIIAPYINEMLKFSKKISVLVILAIMTVGVIGIGAVLKISESAFMYVDDGSGNQTDEFEMIEVELADSREQLTLLEKQLESATDPAEIDGLKSEKAYLTGHIELLQAALDYEIPINSSSDYRVQALYEAVDIKTALNALESIPEADRTAGQKTMILSHTARLASLEAVVSGKDFRAYIDMRNSEIDADSTLTDAEKQIKKEGNELWYQADPSGGLEGKLDSYSIQSALSQIETYKLSLRNNLDYTRGDNAVYPLTPAGRTQIADKLAVLSYRLVNGLGISQANFSISEMACRTMLNFGLFMIVLLMMILAGGAVSQEIATGSIKSLIISPARRWKIFAAKVLSLLSMGLAAVLFLYALTMIVQGFLFGFASGTPYVYSVNGNVGEMNFYAFILGYLLADFIDVIVYMALALMLSVITRNTAVSVGVSVGIYFIGSLVSQVLMVFSMMNQAGEWMKFIPFSNLALAADMFPFDTYNNLFNAVGGLGLTIETPSVLFSLVYLAVLVICLGYTALDSFVRRDIK